MFSFCDEVPGSPLKGREVDAVHVGFIRIFDMILHTKLTANMVSYGLSKWIEGENKFTGPPDCVM